MIVLGPVPCQGCRRPVYWNGWEWKRPADSKRHVCRVPNVRSMYDGIGGVSTEPNRMPVAATVHLLTPGSGRRVASRE